MAIRTSYRHNKDGSITKTTTYRRKTILGNTRSESFSERIEPKPKKEKKQMNPRTKKIIKYAIIAYLVVAAILIIRQAMLA